VVLAADPKSRPIRELAVDTVSMACGSVGREIDVAELRSILRAGPVQLIDVREDWERAEDAILPSHHVPLRRLEQAPAGNWIGGMRTDVPTVVYCAAGVRSLRAVEILREQFGFHAARSLRGGMHAWRAR
jgi:adenylyltransferase/sulfurtransferase